MQINNEKLPVLYNRDAENDNTDCGSISEQEPKSENTHLKETIKSKKSTRSFDPVPFYIFSVLLCLLAVFSVTLCLFSAGKEMISAEKIIEYFASDFLGVDINSTDKNIYEFLMSGSFGEDNSQDNNDNSLNANTQNKTEEDKNDQLPPEDDDLPTETEKGPAAEPEIPEGEYAIITTDLSSKEITISNRTEYEIDVNNFLDSSIQEQPYTLSINEDMTIDPLVLIIHTHGTEAYSEEGSVSYSETKNLPRSDDVTKNIVAVGSEMAKILNKNGIPTLHCQIMHDKESYQNSYERAKQSIKQYIEKYPSIKYVFDIHRDSIVGDNKIKYRPLTSINGEATAQIMFVMGSNVNTPEHKDWEKNLTLALKTTELLNTCYDGFTRTMSLRESSYNQQYTNGSLLIEIGSCGNTLSEAKRAGVICAESLSEMILKGW